MMIAFIAAGALAAGVLSAWRRVRFIAHPETWPAGLPFAGQLRLTRAYFKQDGWSFLEPLPPMFIRAQKGRVGVALVIHADETLSLPTLLKDCINLSVAHGFIIGILSQQSLQAEFQADAARNGIYVISPADLPDIGNHIRRTALLQRQAREAGLLPPAATSGSAMAKALSA